MCVFGVVHVDVCASVRVCVCVCVRTHESVCAGTCEDPACGMQSEYCNNVTTQSMQLFKITCTHTETALSASD